MNKEVIMIYEENNSVHKEIKFPFWYKIYRIKILKKNITKVVKLQKDIEETINYVILNITKTVMSAIMIKE